MTALYARPVAMFGAAVIMFIGTGCATKKHVRQTVGPVEARVSQAEKRNTEQQAAIGELGNSVSRADEKAMDAERKAREAGEAAQTAHNRADTAHSLAESTRARLTELSENIDNYKMVTAENILFKVNRHELTKEAIDQLDTAVAQLQGSKNFILEIQGFTDATGSATHNLELSRKRADSVVRYLTVKHNVPLRKINVLGVGEDDPTADNKSKEGRMLARRVEMRVYALDLGGQTNAGAAATPTTTSQTTPPATVQ